MPTIKQQGRTGTPAVNGKPDLRSRIRDVAEIESGLKFSLYGQTKTGKTRLACTFPGKKLILGFEEGTKSVSNVPDVKHVMIESSEEFDAYVRIGVEDGYDTFIVDTAGGFQMILLKEQLGLKGVPLQLSWGLAKQQDWMAVGANFKDHMNRLLDLTRTEAKNVVVIAHERNFTKEEEAAKGADPCYGSALTPAACEWLNGACDFICQTYIKEKVELRETVVNGQKKVAERRTGKVEYVLRVAKHLHYTGGFRVPIGQEDLLEDIADPTYAKILRILQGKRK